MPDQNGGNDLSANQPPITRSAPQESEVQKGSRHDHHEEKSETLKLESDIRTGEICLIVINGLLLVTTIVIAIIYLAQLHRMTRATNASEKAANATQESVRQARKALEASVEQSHLDQRAWVGLAEPKIDDFSEDKYPRISFRFVNSGKTPAIDVKTQVDWMPSEVRGPICGEPGRSRQFYEGPIIPPQGQYVLRDPSHNPWYLENSTHQRQHWDQASQVTFFCFFGEISYKDIFTAEVHTTHFCIYGDDPKKPNGFLYCPKGNDMN